MKTRIFFWHYLASGEKKSPVEVYGGVGFNKGFRNILVRYEINRTIRGQFDLHINAVAPEDAGVYDCEKTGSLAKAYSQVVVIGMLRFLLLSFSFTRIINFSVNSTMKHLT